MQITRRSARSLNISLGQLPGHFNFSWLFSSIANFFEKVRLVTVTLSETSSSEPSARESELLTLKQLHIKKYTTFIPKERLDNSDSNFPFSLPRMKDSHISEQSVEITWESMAHAKDYFVIGGM